MTHFATERALWEISNSPENVQQFSSNPDGLLDRYTLSDEEKKLIKEKNVRVLADQGNSQMLLMMFWIAVSGGFQSLPEYLGRMNAPAQ